MRAGSAAVLSAVFMASMLACVPQPPLVQTAAAVYWCSMHPAVRGAAGERCPICAMPLVPAGSGIGDAFALDIELTPAAPIAGAMTRARLQVRNPRTGATITQFDPVHEKPFHLFVVSRDLAHFAHLHPSLDSGGTLEIALALPAAGHYQLIADFVPAGASPQFIQRTISTRGADAPLSHVAPLVADLAEKIVDGTRIRLTMRDAVAGGPRLMTFNLSDERTGDPVRDLEPYLGAAGHLLVVSSDFSGAAHSHPLVEEGSASAVAFQVPFRQPGIHRVWVQFQRGGRVLTAAFTVDAQPRYRAGT